MKEKVLYENKCQILSIKFDLISFNHVFETIDANPEGMKYPIQSNE